MTEGAPLLELRGVSKVFGAVRALSGVDLDIRGRRGHRARRVTTAPASP